jgi:uncharacterized phage-associated protein
LWYTSGVSKQLSEQAKGDRFMAKYTASKVATWFINHNQLFVNKEEADLLSNLKLQKLLYYAQGSSLALNDYPLFDDTIEAWKHGPVIKSVYFEYNRFGAGGIDLVCSEPQFDKVDKTVLMIVFDKYNRYSANQLRLMTHKEAPWRESAQGASINHSSIKEYFSNYVYKSWLDGSLLDRIPAVEVKRTKDGIAILPAY